MTKDFYNAIYDALQDGLYSFNSEGKILQINKAATEILGFKKEELLGQIGHNLFHLHSFTEQLPIEECPICKAFFEKKSYKREEYFRKKDGTIILAEVLGSPFCDDKQIISGYVVLFRDITEKRRQEDQILALNKVVQESRDIIVIKDLNLKVIATNKAFAKASGKSSVEELIGKTDAQIFGVSEETEPIKSYMEDELRAQKLPAGKFIKTEEPVLYPSGIKKIFKTIKFPVYDGKKLIATANISSDITQEKEYKDNLEKKIQEAIEKAKESDLFYNQIFNTANLGICLTNLEGRFVAVNPEYCNIYGYKEHELIGNHFTMVVPPEYRQTLTKLHDEFLIEKKTELSREWEVMRKDGAHIHILATASLLDNITGGPYKITTITDVTEAHKAREIQQSQEAILIQQSKMAAMGEMLGAIAHQWRQPLNAISCTALDIKLKKEMELLDDATLSTSLSDLENLTQEMSRTIDDFMNFFKKDKKTLLFYVYDCFSYALKIFAAQFKSQQISVDVNIDKDLKLNGILGELEQVFLNFLSNAKDAFAEGNIKDKQVKIYSVAEEQSIKIVFEDNAGGIEENKVNKIFNPYFTTKQRGTGIGLYMSSLILKNTFNAKAYAQNIYNEDHIRVGLQITCEFSKEQ